MEYFHLFALVECEHREADVRNLRSQYCYLYIGLN